MIARVFVAALIAVLTLGACVAGWASSAWAECAWVLWLETTVARTVDTADEKAGTSVSYEIGVATPAAGQCGELVRANVKRRATAFRTTSVPLGAAGSVKVDETTATVTQFTGNGFIMSRYVCLPDGTDPRAPKGSGR